MRKLSDKQLQEMTDVFKKRVSEGESLDHILPEAFAAMCEADFRVLKMYPHDVQIMGGIALHKGMLAEMNTGEGKTLVATLPLYLNALAGKKCMLMTTNDYLANRDCKEMGPAYEFMGLSVGCCVPDVSEEKEESDEKMDRQIKRDIYSRDIIYGTNSAIGFDYLMNNLVATPEDRFMCDFNYVIVDEADEVLLDSANMPLVIAGSPRVQSNLYEQADFFITTLVENVDYEKDEASAWLTEKGIHRAEVYYKIDNLFDKNNFEINRHVNLALKAHMLMEKGKDYVVSEKNEVVLVDGSTGRMLNGVKMHGGIHQAVEAKEHVYVTQETRSVASITYQNLFGLFDKVSGMSGTISDTKEEIRNIYKLDTVVIPPNKPIVRKDNKDKYFVSRDKQLEAAVKSVARAYEIGQPVLVVAAAIKDTEKMSDLLIKKQIPHSVLNARNTQWEAEIVKEAGRLGAITVATSIAGRGTDIKLGPGVRELGGLMVIGLGRMRNSRLERQARGRAGRQGDPGSSYFFVSLEDEVVNGGDEEIYEKYTSGKRRIGKRKLRKIIDSAQKTAEEVDESSRQRSVEMGMVIKKQRELIYETRDHLLGGVDIDESQFLKIVQKVVEDFVSSRKKISHHDVQRFMLDNITYRLDDDFENKLLKKKKLLKKYLVEKGSEYYRAKKEKIDDDERFMDFVRIATLTAVDNEWVEEVDYLQQLPSAVSGRSSAQRNTVFEYENDAIESYRMMEKSVYRHIVRNVLLSSVYFEKDGEISIVFP